MIHIVVPLIVLQGLTQLEDFQRNFTALAISISQDSCGISMSAFSRKAEGNIRLEFSPVAICCVGRTQRPQSWQ